MSTTLGARLAPAAAAVIAMAAFTALQSDRGAAVESAYLALLAAAVLTAVALLPRPGWVALATAGTASAMVVWAVPAGPSRGMAMVVVLVAVWLQQGLLENQSDRLAGGYREAVALALGLQLVARSELLLEPLLEPRVLVALLALPAAGGLATAVLARRHGPVAVVAAGVLVAFAPGFRVAPTLVLVGLAAAELSRSPANRDRLVGALTGLAALGAAALWRPAFAAALVAAIVLTRAPRRGSAVAAVLAVAALALALPGARVPWAEAAAGLPWLALLVPALPFARRGSGGALVAAAVLAAGALRWLPLHEALPVPLALVVLRLRPEGAPFRLQRIWTAVLVVGSTILAAYPWLRARPLDTLLPRLGLEPGWVAAVTLAAALAALAWAASRWERSKRPALATLAVAVLTAAAVAGLPGAAERPLGGEVVVLDASSPSWSAELSGERAVRVLVVDSHLSNGHLLAAGTPVATVRLEGGGRSRSVKLAAGRDTGEWAARRPDVAALPGLAIPEPWIAWVAPGRFFAQRYRARHSLEPAPAPDRIAVELARGLPAELTLALYHLELRR